MTREQALKLPTNTAVVYHRPGTVNHGDYGRIVHEGARDCIVWDDGCALSFSSKYLRYVRLAPHAGDKEGKP